MGKRVDFINGMAAIIKKQKEGDRDYERHNDELEKLIWKYIDDKPLEYMYAKIRRL